jgi:hypothetical protein
VRFLGGAVLAAGLIVVPLASAAQFGRPAEIPLAGTPVAVGVVDVTQDGNGDLVVANAGAPPLTLLRGNGTGAFEAPVPFGTGPAARAIAVYDLDNDGGDDLAVVGGNEVAVYLAAEGSFVRHGSLVAPSVSAVLASDLDFDGNADLLAAASNRPVVTVFRGLGDGTFLPGTEYSAGRSAATALFAADLNGDDLTDLVTGGDGVSVLLGNDDGTLGAPVGVTDTPGVTALTGGDFDGDGDVDLALARSPNVVGILLNDGEGLLSAGGTYQVGGAPVALAASFVDDDASLDLVTANRGTNDVSLLLGTESGGFQPPTRARAGNGPAGLALSDLDGNGTTDLVVADRLSKSVTVLLNGADAPQPVVCRVPVLAHRTLATARRIVSAANCRVGSVRRKYSGRIKRGKVIAVTPLPGTRRPVGTTVTLLVSRGPKPKR